MPLVCGVRFKGTGKVYYFAPPKDDELAADDHVIVETARGRELAQVVSPTHEVDETEIVGDLKSIARRATSLDLLEAERYRQQAISATEQCQKQVAAAGLQMKIVNAEYSYDGSRLTFFFAAEKRIDFRELVRNLARTFKTRIELRQIGVRDEAKVIGGCGKCGRSLCCATWLTHFSPVSIRMAKQQDLPLSPMEISGCCGRLLCCLAYENGYYGQVKRQFPKVGRTIECPLGRAKVIKVSAMEEKATLLLEDGTRVKATPAQIKGEEPLERPLSPMQRALESTLQRTKAQNEGDQETREGGRRSNQGRSSRPSRSRRGASGTGGNDRRRSSGRRPTSGSPQTGPSEEGQDSTRSASTEGDSSETPRRSGRSRRRRSSSRNRRPAGQGRSGDSRQGASGGDGRSAQGSNQPPSEGGSSGRSSSSRRRRRRSSSRRRPQGNSGSGGKE